MKIIKDISCGIKDPKKLALHKTENTRANIKDFKRALTGTINHHHIFLIKTSFEKTILTIEKQQD